jgi:2-oxoglutarate ferredoxin oxidoreductase subunit alpha
MQALYGRNGESPVVVIAASTPANCFDYAFEAARIAVERMTPVVLLTDGFIANGSQPWKIPSMKDYPVITTRIVKEGTKDYLPYARDVKTLVRSWAIPGTKGLEHRIGGLEKDELTGNVSYVPENHQKMTEIREEKVERVIDMVPDLEVLGEQEGDLLVVGWGGTYGHLKTAVQEMHVAGEKIGLAHFNYIKPLPANVKEVFSKYKKIVVCELNLGQFVNYLRMKHQEFHYEQFNKIQGLPFTMLELKEKFSTLLDK